MSQARARAFHAANASDPAVVDNPVSPLLEAAAAAGLLFSHEEETERGREGESKCGKKED